MADIGLEAIESQDHATRRGGQLSQPRAFGERERPQFIAAIQLVADAPHADGHAASRQFGIDLEESDPLLELRDPGEEDFNVR
jgi:hypothetical protein